MQIDWLIIRKTLICMEVLRPLETVSACENKNKQSHHH